MKAVVITQPGGPEVLSLQEVADPQAGPGQIVIDIHASALNRADLLQRQGVYPPPAGAPPYPGLEAAGRVFSVGKDVASHFKPQMPVMALLAGGGYAEKVVVGQETVMPVPDGLSWAEAAAIPEVWLTAYSNMIEIGRLAKGERVLIHAGGSGVGSAAIQLAKRLGATVFSTASAKKMARVEALGADVVIDYRKENFADRILEETNGQGVELIIDFIGAPYWHDNLRALTLWGRLVLVGLMGGHKIDANLGLFLRKKLSVHGSTLRDRTLEQKGSLVKRFNRDVLPALASGELRPILDSRQFRLDQIVDAHRYMAANQNFGKIILNVK
ncbi:MAG: NAD(P)H-quinone oxidoreductase [Ardenticatenaceae bacterium]